MSNGNIAGDRAKEKQYHMFAWQGLQIETPMDWEPARLMGTAKKGDITLEDEDGLRLELRWEPAAKSWKPGDAIDAYAKILERDNRGGKGKFRVKRGRESAPESMEDAETFLIRGAVKEAGLSARCKRCSRAIIMRMRLKPGDRTGHLMKRVFGSLRDHGEDGWTSWSLFGFQFSLREDYKLRHSELSVGRLHLSFSRHGRSADAVRLRPASVLLKDGSLVDCVNRQLALMKMKNTPLEEFEFKGGPAVRLENRAKKRLLKSSARKLRAWRDPDADSIYMAYWNGPEKEAQDFEKFADSFADSRVKD